MLQLYDAFNTFGVKTSRRDDDDDDDNDDSNNNDDDDDDDDLFYSDSFKRPPRRRYRTTGSRPSRPLGDMASPSTGGAGRSLWDGWEVGQSDDGNTPSSLFDAEHPLKKYRRYRFKFS